MTISAQPPVAGPDWHTPFIVAHRANAPGAAENSLSGIRANGALGTDLVELDVRRSLGGTPFIHHDWYLGRDAPGGRLTDPVPVRFTPARLLRRLSIGDEHEDHVAELAEALDLIASDLALPGPHCTSRIRAASGPCSSRSGGGGSARGRRCGCTAASPLCWRGRWCPRPG